jgi:hypothetical protein
VQLARVAVAHHQAAALAGKPGRDRATDSASGTSDDRDATVERHASKEDNGVRPDVQAGSRTARAAPPLAGAGLGHFTEPDNADTLTQLERTLVTEVNGAVHGRAERELMAREKFKTKVEAGERGRVFITIPFVPSDKWGKKPRHFVKGTINTTAFSGSLGSRSGVYFFPLNKDLQDEAAVGPGDAVTVVIEPQDGAASSDLPDDLAEALTGEPKAREFLDGLSAFYRNTYLKWITEAKKPETRAARVEQTVRLLKQGKKQR